MASTAPVNTQLTFGPAPAKKVVAEADAHKKFVSPEIASAFCAAGVLIDQARERAGLSRKEVCSLMFIDEPRYSKWVAGTSPTETASFARLLLLPPQFWFHLNQLLNERFGLRRLIAAQLLGVAADLALAEAK